MQIISGFGSSLYWLKSEEAVRDGLDRHVHGYCAGDNSYHSRPHGRQLRHLQKRAVARLLPPSVDPTTAARRTAGWRIRSERPILSRPVLPWPDLDLIRTVAGGVADGRFAHKLHRTRPHRWLREGRHPLMKLVKVILTMDFGRINNSTVELISQAAWMF